MIGGLLLLLLATTAWADAFPHMAIVGVNTCTAVTGNVTPLYMAAGTCVDPTEAKVEQKLAAAGTVANLACIASADPGSGRTITVTGRVGTCGTLANSGTFVCTLTGGSGRPSCTSGTTTMALTAGQCWTVKLDMTGGAFAAAAYINCTLERPL